jgi:hypothetical protein
VLAQVTNNVEPFIDVKTILLLIGCVTPFVTALIAKANASETLKGAISACVIALSSALYGWIEADELTWQLWLNGSLQILFTHIASYFMLTSRAVNNVNASTPGVIGPSPHLNEGH